MAFSKLSLASALAGLLALSGCQTMDMQMGSQSAKTVATGSAAGGATSGESSQLERCDSPLGTVSLIENQSAGWYTVLTGEYKLPPTANLLRLLVQQSNCFVVVERGAAGMNAMTRERALQQSGEMRGGSNFGRGQMVASDYGLSPEIVFSNSDAGGLGGALGGLVGGGRGRAIAQLGASMQTKEASALLTLIDNRSGVQVAAAEGSASKTRLRRLRQPERPFRCRRHRRLHAHAPRQGDCRRVHGRFQPDGSLAAQLQGTDRARPGPRRWWPPGRRRRRRTVADLCAGREAGAHATPQQVTGQARGFRHRTTSRQKPRRASPVYRMCRGAPAPYPRRDSKTASEGFSSPCASPSRPA
jgi:hypothetical protein